MVDGRDDVEFELAIRGCLEDASVDFNFFDARAVEFFESRDDAGFFASTGRAVDEEVWEVAGLCLRWLDGLFAGLK